MVGRQRLPVVGGQRLPVVGGQMARSKQRFALFRAAEPRSVHRLIQPTGIYHLSHWLVSAQLNLYSTFNTGLSYLSSTPHVFVS